ncbi:hypothetical protein GOODEAATRI_002204 [Goodea atripinnis]|uniref:Cortactin-binding protein-2 N-terminal domain-containing protein n=1 Tax=Goodea atripinnis TaxID=208336 RepID=A0ABV0N782_9TELE
MLGGVVEVSAVVVWANTITRHGPIREPVSVGTTLGDHWRALHWCGGVCVGAQAMSRLGIVFICSSIEPFVYILLSDSQRTATCMIFCQSAAQRKEVFLQDRYGHYTLTDPFLALQRDFECRAPGGDKERRPLGSSPISVLEAVMAHCRKMQERMSAQLAAAESRQKRVRNPFIRG